MKEDLCRSHSSEKEPNQPQYGSGVAFSPLFKETSIGPGGMDLGRLRQEDYVFEASQPE